MSYMDRKNILEEGIIDKLLQLITKSSKKTKEKEAKKAYKKAEKQIRKTKKELDAALRRVGVDPKQFEV